MSLLTRKRGVPTPQLDQVRFELSCGAVLLVSPRATAPVTAVQMHMRGLLANDPEGLEGTAYLSGALLDQGTGQRSEEDIVSLLEPAGGEVSGDAMGLSGTIVGSEWKLLCELMSEVITDPRYPAKEVGRQKKRVLDRLTVERDDPRAQGRKLFRGLVYGDHWVGRPNYGTLESVSKIEPRHLRAFHKKYWLANRVTISVCGNVEPEKVRRHLNRLLADWKRGPDYEPFEREFPELGKRVASFPAARQQVHVYLGHLGIKRSNPDYAALAVMDHILGTGPGFTNRISRKLRDEQGLCYSVSAAIHSSAGLLPGAFMAYIGTSPEHVETAIRGFLDEIREIRDHVVGPDELETAKSYLLGSYALGFERASRRASYMITQELHKFPADQLERLPREFDAVSIEDIQRVARTYLHPDRCCLAAAGSTSKKELVRILDSASRAAV